MPETVSIERIEHTLQQHLRLKLKWKFRKLPGLLDMIPPHDNIGLKMNISYVKKNSEHRFVSRTVSKKKEDSQTNWTMDIRVKKRTDVPIFVIVSFQSTRLGPDQVQNNAIFHRLPITEAHCSIRTTRYPDIAMKINFTTNNYKEAYNEIRQLNKKYIGGEGISHNSFKA